MLLLPSSCRACLAGVALIAATSSCQKSEAPAAKAVAPASAPASSSAAAAKPAATLPEPVRKVLGKWLRSDGTYVLELRSADLSGVIDAGYFNPKSIHVSRAIWMQGSSGLQVVVELNDVGYPGATYVLSHDPQADRLVGQYTQPQMQQTFDIDFVRQPTP